MTSFFFAPRDSSCAKLPCNTSIALATACAAFAVVYEYVANNSGRRKSYSIHAMVDAMVDAMADTRVGAMIDGDGWCHGWYHGWCHGRFNGWCNG